MAIGGCLSALVMCGGGLWFGTWFAIKVTDATLPGALLPGAFFGLVFIGLVADLGQRVFSSFRFFWDP
jgi:hypothetical protein